MKTLHKYVGLVVHNDTTVNAAADGGREGELRLHGEISPTSARSKKSCANSAATV